MEIDDAGILLPGENSAYIMFKRTTDLLEAYATSEMDDPEVRGQVVSFLLCQEAEMLANVERLSQMKASSQQQEERRVPSQARGRERTSLEPVSSTTSASYMAIPGICEPEAKNLYDDVDGVPMEESLSSSNYKHGNDKAAYVKSERKREDKYLYDKSPDQGRRSKPFHEGKEEKSQSNAPKLDYYQLITGGGKLLNYEQVSSRDGEKSSKSRVSRFDVTPKSKTMKDFYQGYNVNPSAMSVPEPRQSRAAKRSTTDRPKFTERKVEEPSSVEGKVIVGYSDSDDSTKQSHSTGTKRVRTRRRGRAQRSRSLSRSRRSTSRSRKRSRSRSRDRDRKTRNMRSRSRDRRRRSKEKEEKRSDRTKDGSKETSKSSPKSKKESEQAKETEAGKKNETLKDLGKSKESEKSQDGSSVRKRDGDKAKDEKQRKETVSEKKHDAETNKGKKMTGDKGESGEKDKQKDRSKDEKSRDMSERRSREKSERKSRDHRRSTSRDRTNSRSRDRSRSPRRSYPIRQRQDRSTGSNRSRSRSFSPIRSFRGRSPDRRPERHRPSADPLEGHYVFLKNLPPWCTVYSIHQMFDDCSVVRESTKLVSNEGIALYAYLQVASQSDVYKACQRDKTSIGNIVITVKPLSAVMYTSELRELEALERKGPSALKVLTVHSMTPSSGAAYPMPQPMYGGRPPWGPGFPPHGPGGPPGMPGMHMPHPPFPPRPILPPGMHPPMPPAMMPPGPYHPGFQQLQPPHPPHPPHPPVHSRNEAVTRTTPKKYTEMVRFSGFPTDDSGHTKAVRQYLKITGKGSCLVNSPEIEKTPNANNCFTVKVTLELEEGGQALPRSAVIGSVFCYIDHARQLRNCPVCRYPASHAVAVGSCAGMAPQNEIAVLIDKNSPLSPYIGKDIVYKDKRYPSIMGVLDNLMTADEEGGTPHGPQRHTWLLSKINLLIDIYQTRIRNCKDSFSLLARFEKRKPIVFLDSDPVLGIGMQHLPDSEALLSDIKAKFRDGENMIGQVLSVHREKLPSKVSSFEVEMPITNNPQMRVPQGPVAPFGPSGNAPVGPSSDVAGNDFRNVGPKHPSFGGGMDRRNSGDWNRDFQAPPIQPMPRNELRNNESGQREAVTFSGFPDMGYSLERLYSTIADWLNNTAPGIRIFNIEVTDQRSDQQGTTYNIVTAYVAGPLIPALSAFSIINNVACIVKHPSQLHCCQVCKKPHDDACEGIIPPSETKRYFHIHETHKLDPNKPFPFLFRGKEFPSFMEALVSFQKQDLGEDVVDKHKIYTWEANNYNLMEEMLMSQIRQTRGLTNYVLHCIPGSRKVVYLNEDLVLGSGSYSKVDIKNVIDTYYPGLNYYGRMLFEIREKLRTGKYMEKNFAKGDY